MKTQTHQMGRTFSGILIGLVIAVVVIAGLLWFLNNNKTTFQKHDVVTEEVIETEELAPPAIEEPHPVGVFEEGSQTQWDDEAASEETPKDAIEDIIVAKEKTKTEVPSVKPKETIAKPSEPAKDKGKGEETKPVKVSPEQILNSGSIEKAREQVKQEQVGTISKGKKVTLQAGSYGNENAANTQRARLIMMGVDAKIETAQVNGKTVYRVKTNALVADQAAKVGAQLKNNGIDYMAIPSK